jgi:hypothetical protein
MPARFFYFALERKNHLSAPKFGAAGSDSCPSTSDASSFFREN